MLAKILSKHHGFHCTVLFAINPDSGVIDPNYNANIPGTDALAEADLMILATRWRVLPDEQIEPIYNFLKAGKPLICFPHRNARVQVWRFWRLRLGQFWNQRRGRELAQPPWQAQV